MVYTFRVYKKESPNGKLTVYLGKRDYVDHLTAVDPVDGVVLVDRDYLKDRKVFGQVVVTFRYGREEDEVMGLTFSKDLYLASEQIYPAHESKKGWTSLQERLMKKFGADAIPFSFKIPQQAPASVTLQPGAEDQGQPCGVEYVVKLYVASGPDEKPHKRSTIGMVIRKVQYAPGRQGKQPCTVVRKDFLLSPGQLELEVTLDKQLYHHGEALTVNFNVRNHSNKMVKRIKASVVQHVDVCLFATGQYRTTVAAIETQEGCPIGPGSSLQKTVVLTPLLQFNKDRRGIALDGRLKHEDTNLASTTLLLDPDQKDTFGIIVSYAVRVKLFLGAVGGEVVAELPFILMHPRPKPKPVRADSQWDVEQMTSSRQNTFDDDDGDDKDMPAVEDLIPSAYEEFTEFKDKHV